MRFRLKTLLLPSSRKSPKKEDANFKKDASKFLSPQKQGENSKKDPLSKPSPLKEEVHNSQDSETNKILACRICLDSDSDEENPLVSPCKCAGTMGMIHVGCLQKWLKSKVVVKKNVISVCYQWKNLNCELCSSPFPGYFYLSIWLTIRFAIFYCIKFYTVFIFVFVFIFLFVFNF